MDKRPKNKTLTADLLDLFYQVLIFCESDAINEIKFRIKDSCFNEFISYQNKKKEKGKVYLNYNTKLKKKNINKIDFNKELELNEIRFINTKQNVIKSLLWHLRHAFAHNRLSFNDNSNKILCIENVYNGKTKMKAKVRTADLKKFIKFVLQN